MKTTEKPSPLPKSGAPFGNTNGAKNGTRMTRLILGELPPSMSRVTRYCRKYRRALEQATEAAHGDVTVAMAHLIDAACTHEQHAQVCRWLLRDRIDKMAAADILECSKQITAAKDSRNRAVKALNLDQHDKNVFDALSQPVADDAAQDADHGDATDSGESEPADEDNAKSGRSGALDTGGSQEGGGP